MVCKIHRQQILLFMRFYYKIGIGFIFSGRDGGWSSQVCIQKICKGILPVRIDKILTKYYDISVMKR